MFTFTIIRSSSAIESITCNLIVGSCVVTYKNGATYGYVGVSRRAMLNLQLNDNISLGFWVNDNLLFCERNVNTYKFA